MISITDGRVSTVLLFSAALAAVVSASGCGAWVPESPNRPELVAKGEEGPVRIVRRDGSSIVLVAPIVADDSLVGSTQVEPPQRIAIAVSDIQSVDKPKFSFDKTMDGVQTTTTVTLGIIFTFTTLVILAHVP